MENKNKLEKRVKNRAEELIKCGKIIKNRIKMWKRRDKNNKK